LDDTPFDMATLRVAQILNFSTSVFGAEFLLFVTIELEFQPGVPGLIFAVGGARPGRSSRFPAAAPGKR